MDTCGDCRCFGLNATTTHTVSDQADRLRDRLEREDDRRARERGDGEETVRSSQTQHKERDMDKAGAHGSTSQSVHHIRVPPAL